MVISAAMTCDEENQNYSRKSWRIRIKKHSPANVVWNKISQNCHTFPYHQFILGSLVGGKQNCDTSVHTTSNCLNWYRLFEAIPIVSANSPHSHAYCTAVCFSHDLPYCSGCIPFTQDLPQFSGRIALSLPSSPTVPTQHAAMETLCTAMHTITNHCTEGL